MEKAMAPHSSTLAWKIPWTEEPGRPAVHRSRRVRHDWATSLSLSCTGEGNGNPLQRSCLENPRDGGAWWAAVYGVAQGQTRLKRLSSSSSSCWQRRYEEGGFSLLTQKSSTLLTQEGECPFYKPYETFTVGLGDYRKSLKAGTLVLQAERKWKRDGGEKKWRKRKAWKTENGNYKEVIRR